MLEFNLFNVAQFLDQGLAILGTFLLTSLSARTRMYGFIVFLLLNIPSVYLLVVTELLSIASEKVTEMLSVVIETPLWLSVG